MKTCGARVDLVWFSRNAITLNPQNDNQNWVLSQYRNLRKANLMMGGKDRNILGMRFYSSKDLIVNKQ